MARLLTEAGWQERDYIDWDVDKCFDCGKDATFIVDGGPGILWAVCSDCEVECEIARIDGERQAHDEMYWG